MKGKRSIGTPPENTSGEPLASSVRKVTISEIALAEFSEVLYYIRERSPDGSVQTERHFEMAVEEITEDFHLCRPFEHPAIPSDYKILRKNFGNSDQFCILFEGTDEEIKIHFVSRGARNLSAHLADALDE